MENFKFSYSSCNTFKSCPYAFDLLYNQRVDRTNNYYGQFGSVMHKVMEDLLLGKVDIYELEDLYNLKYDESITCRPPMGSAETYYTAGLNFFKYFSVLLDQYEIIAIENRLEFEYQGHNIVCVPDLLIKEKSTGKVILFDYKTSSAKTEKECNVKVKKEGYDKQAFMYVWAVWETLGIVVDEIRIWFLRPNIQVVVPWTQDDIDATRDNFTNTINEIVSETEWIANNENQFFCNFICSARLQCPFKKEIKKDE